MIRSTFGQVARGLGMSLLVWGGSLALVDSCEATVSCETAAATLEAAPLPQRMEVALAIVAARCQPLPHEISEAMKTRRWADRAPLWSGDRVSLLTAAVAQGYEEAIALSVSVLESGAWGQGEPLDPVEGAGVIEGLAPALDSYRTLLLLDVYEQVAVPEVRLAVVRALRQGPGPEALLPALDAYWNETGEIKALAAEVIAAQPEKTAEAVLTRVARQLQPGAVLSWAARLGKTHGVPAAVEAAQRD